MAGKELGEGKQGKIKPWRFEQIIQGLEGQSRIYSKCDGQPLGDLKGGSGCHLIYFVFCFLFF